MSTVSTCRGTSIARQSPAQNSAQRGAFGLMPWLTWIAASAKRSSGASSARSESRTTESTPPERPTASRAPGGTDGARRAATRLTSSFELGFLVFAIAHQALEAILDERRDVLLRERAQRVLQRLLEGERHRRGVAVRAAERLVQDAVDEPERLQPARGDAERLGRLGRLVGALPQDGRAAFGRDHRVGRVLQHLHQVSDRDRERAA